MDAIVTYVNGNDPLWLEDYSAAAGADMLEKRFRDWGTLRYLFRGIGAFLPFVDRVHLVVSRESQVPAWVDRDKMNIVLHRDIIPGRFLPVFNSSAIEMFLHRIPGLSERFLYFNDDMFVVKDCSEEDFFPGGKPAIGFAKNLFHPGDFRFLVHHSDTLARKAAGLPASLWYLRPQHAPSPMLRTECEKVYSLVEDEIMRSVTPLRSRVNYNQYLFLDYMFYTGKAMSRRLSNKHFSLAASTAGSICSFLRNPDRKMVCINDVQMPSGRAEKIRPLLQGAFSELLPKQSVFERQI